MSSIAKEHSGERCVERGGDAAGRTAGDEKFDLSGWTSRGSDDGAVENGVQDVVEAVLIASRVLVAVSARSLTDLDDAVTPTQFRSLVILDGHGEMNLNGLAEILGVNASTAMRTIAASFPAA